MLTRSISLLILVLASVSFPLNAQTSDSDPLKVGVREVPPFSFQQNGEWTGLTLDLWNQIADELNLEYQLVEQNSVSDLLNSLENNEVDLLASGISLTAERERKFDFSHPFLTSNLAILTTETNSNYWLVAAMSFVSLPFLIAMSSLAIVLLGAGFLLYIFERKANPDEFNSDLPKGLGDAFWWAAVTMTTVGYGDKSPRSLGGRLVALVWMFLSVIILSSFTASIVSSLDVARSGSEIEGLEDLKSGMVASISGSVGEKILLERQIQPRTFPDFESIFAAIQDGKVNAFVYDKPILTYYMKQLPGDFHLIDLPDYRDEYGFVLPERDELREPINQTLLRILASPEWQRTRTKYID